MEGFYAYSYSVTMDHGMYDMYMYIHTQYAPICFCPSPLSPPQALTAFYVSLYSRVGSI